LLGLCCALRALAFGGRAALLGLCRSLRALAFGGRATLCCLQRPSRELAGPVPAVPRVLTADLGPGLTRLAQR